LFRGTEEGAFPSKTAGTLDANDVLRAQRRFKDFDREPPVTDLLENGILNRLSMPWIDISVSSHEAP